MKMEIKEISKIASVVRRVVPYFQEEFELIDPEIKKPEIGDVVVGRIKDLGFHVEMENPNGRNRRLYPGDVCVFALANRYATAEYEGLVPKVMPETLHILNYGGCCGMVTEKNITIPEPTTFEVLGYLSVDGEILNTKNFSIDYGDNAKPMSILVVGTDMNAGKTTTASSIIRALTYMGYNVDGIKITGVGRMRDTLAMKDAGARNIYDFVDAGYPSTYLISEEELINIFELLYSNCASEFLVMEFADSILQRETNMLLHSNVMKKVDMVILSASCTFSAIGALNYLKEQLNIEVNAISGPFSNSGLSVREFTEYVGTDIPVFSALEKHEDLARILV